MNTYGDCRDDTLYAVACLLTEPPKMLTTAQLSRVLDCRDSLLISMRRQFRLATGEAGSGSVGVAAVEANPTAALGTLLSDLPRTGPGQAPTDVLTTRDGHEYVARWQETGRAALLTTDILDSTYAWRTEPSAAWAVVADVAKAAVALPILDTHLAHLASAAGDEQAAKLLIRTANSTLGLTARLTGEIAQQGELHAGLTRLHRPHIDRVEACPLRGFAEVAAGQHRVTQLLRQRRRALPVKALTAVLLGQARIATAIGDSTSRLQAPHTPDGWLNRGERAIAADLASDARARAQALARMARAHKGVADTLWGGQPVVWQTAEVVRAVKRRPAPRDRESTRQQLRQLHQLALHADAVHKLLTRGILEAFATGEYLVPYPERNQLQWRPCTAEAEPPLREATKGLDQVMRQAALPRPLDSQQQRDSSIAAPSASQQLTDALAAQRPHERPTSPGMRIRQPLTP